MAWNPKITISQRSSDYMAFELSGVDVSIANALRRIMMAEIPTLSIDQVFFKENTTSMQDEYIAHRLGLIPIHSRKPLSSFRFRHACDCTFAECEHCTVRFSLDCNFDEMIRTGEYDPSSNSIPITSKHLQCFSRDVDAVNFTSLRDERTCISDTGIVIMQLGPGQSLHLECIATLGIAKEHAKWNPCCTVSMKYDPIIEIDEESPTLLSVKNRTALVESCPTKVFALDENERVVIQNPNNCMFCRECIYLLEDFRTRPEDNLGVSIKHSPNRFYFTVETTGALTAQEVVEQSFEVLNKKVKDIINNVASIRAGALLGK